MLPAFFEEDGGEEPCDASGEGVADPAFGGDGEEFAGEVHGSWAWRGWAGREDGTGWRGVAMRWRGGMGGEERGGRGVKAGLARARRAFIVRAIFQPRENHEVTRSCPAATPCRDCWHAILDI